MANYYTMQELQAKSNVMTEFAAKERLSQSTKSALGTFDIFLSHSFRDAQTILGIRNLLTAQGLRVYVDWIEEPAMNRASVTPLTAARLRDRMQQSKSLVYAVSQEASKSRWMPWELGFFDGIRDGSRVSILPVEGGGGNAFAGEEYLGLYKVIEKVNIGGAIHPYAVRSQQRQAESLASFANNRGQFVNLVTR